LRIKKTYRTLFFFYREANALPLVLFTKYSSLKVLFVMSEQQLVNIQEVSKKLAHFTFAYRNALTLTAGMHHKIIQLNTTSNLTVTLPPAARRSDFIGFKCRFLVKGGGADLTFARNGNSLRASLNHGRVPISDADVVITAIPNSTVVCAFCDGVRWYLTADVVPSSTSELSAHTTGSGLLSGTRRNGTIFTITGASSDISPNASQNTGRWFRVIVSESFATSADFAVTALQGTTMRVAVVGNMDVSSPTNNGSNTCTALTLGGSSSGEEALVGDSLLLVSDGSRWTITGMTAGKVTLA
jgi:hypothetical protein